MPASSTSSSSRPSVLVAHPSADVYGSDRQLIESIVGLRDAGWNVSVHLPDHGPFEGLLGDVPARVGGFPVLQKALLRPVALLGLLVRTPRDLVRLVRRIRAERPDAVYVNTVTIPLWIVAARLSRVPVLVHVHEAEADLPRVLAFVLNLPMLLARAIVANSESSARVLADAVPRLRARTSVIVNGVPDHGPGDRSAVRPGRLAVVGRLSPRKGIDVALEAVALLRDEGRDVSLDVCGTVFAGYEWYESQLRARAERPDLAGAVRLLGYVDPASTVLAQAAVVLVPSRTEPFGNTAVEALLAGRPLVASAVQGLAEIVDDGRTGLLVEPDDAPALAAGIARCLDDPVLADRLALAGRDDALLRFGVGRFRKDIVAAVAGVVGDRRRLTSSPIVTGSNGE